MVGIVRYFLIVCGFAVLLQGCGELPKPFAHDPASPSQPLIDPMAVEVVYVPPVDAIPMGEGLAQAIVSGLALQEIPAIIRDPQRPTPVIEPISLTPIGDSTVIVWQLRGANAEILGSFEQSARTAAWTGTDPFPIQQIARAVAEALGPSLRTGSDFNAERYLLSMTLRNVQAPGNGATALVNALIPALRHKGVEVKPRDGKAVVDVTVSLFPASSSAKERVIITWDVFDAQSGNRLGRIEQKNEIAQGLLSGLWGMEARYIAQGGAEGIADLLDRWRTGALNKDG